MKTARCSVDLDWVARDVRDLVLNQNLQNKRSHFVLKSIAQSFNSRALDDVLKLAADASVGAFNLLSDSGSYRFGSLDVRVETMVLAVVRLGSPVAVNARALLMLRRPC
jgi:hypothetical protein